MNKNLQRRLHESIDEAMAKASRRVRADRQTVSKDSNLMLPAFAKTTNSFNWHSGPVTKYQILLLEIWQQVIILTNENCSNCARLNVELTESFITGKPSSI